jgi:flagellar hook-associated protein 1 FlgK
MTGSVGLLGIAVSGLQVANRALTTTGHNIANVNTEGYTRQRVDVAARPPQFLGGSFVGTGVDVTNTRRLYDAFATTQLRLSTAGVGYADTFHELSEALDNLLADPTTGLSAPLQGFFDATHDVANDPASLPARHSLLAGADALAARFQLLDQALADLDAGVNQRISDAVSEVNSFSRALAQVNHDILLATGRGNGTLPNDLLDQRDALLRKLAEKVSVSVVEQDDGMLNVFTGSGQVLVAGTHASELAVVPGSYDASRLEVGYRAAGQTAIVSDLLPGGELAALVQFRGQVLDQARNALGRVAIGLAETYNTQHRLGFDLGGQAGGDFFAGLGGSAQVLGRAENSGDATIAVSVSDAAALTTSDYLLDRSGAAYTLTRLSDGQRFTLAGFPPGPVEVASEGLSLALDAGAMADGDRFLIRPTAAATRDFALALSDPAEVAARGIAPRVVASNPAGASVSGLAEVAGAGLAPGSSVTLTYDAGNARFTVAPTGDVLAYDPAAGGTYSVGGLKFTVQGTPADGDTLTFTAAAAGVGDNRNALALAGLRNERLLDGGRATCEDAYGGLVVHVGNATRQAEINQSAQRTLLSEATRARETASGVNLDEEAANLLRFQQHYQANAQVIAAAQVLFDTLLQAVAR